MEGTELAGSSGENSSHLQVYKDAFAPPSRPRSRPWERAPVSAHAPRLHGQRIWKRARRNPLQHSGNENDNSGQLELEKEGTGARKKARVLGRKQFISDAPWLQPVEDSAGTTAQVLHIVSSPNKENRNSLHNETTGVLQVIPRKRTNANHPITPRKPSFNSISHNIINKPNLESTILERSPEKSVRRRKSLRKSIGRLTNEGNSQRAVMAIIEDSAKPDFAVEVLPTAITPCHNELLASTPEISLHVEISLNIDDVFPQPHSLPEDTQNHSISKRFQEGDDSRIEEDILERTVDLEVSPVDDCLNQPVLEDVLTEPVPLVTESAVFETVEMHSAPSFSPTKGSGSQKSRRRSNSQRRGTRRSTRSARAGSVPPDSGASDFTQTTDLVVPDVQPLTDQGEPSIELPASSGHLNNYMLSMDTVEQQSIEAGTPDSELELESRPAIISARTEEQEPRNTVSSTGIAGYAPSVLAEVSGPDANSFISEIVNELEGLRDEPCAVKSPSDNQAPRAETVILKPESRMCQVLAIDYAEHDQSKSRKGPIVQIQDLSEEFLEVATDTNLEALEQISMTALTETIQCNIVSDVEELTESTTPDPSTIAPAENISENALPTPYDHDDTNLLRSFLTRVKANKEAKAKTTSRRKRSFPHSPIRLPLEDESSNISPTSPSKDEFDVSLPATFTPIPTTRYDIATEEEDVTEPKSIRRSGRTRLPVKAAAPAPSFIPVRRLGQEGDNTITLRRSEEKELAALTRLNTRKNKAGALSPQEVLAKQAEAKEDPASRQRALKEKFDEKCQIPKSSKRKSVVWAEELAQYQTAAGTKAELDTEADKEKPLGDEKKGAVKVGVRSSRISLGMAMNGTPAPKRRGKARS